MADVTTKTHRQVVQLQAAAIQSQAAGLLDFSTGSILRAIAQAVGGLVMWLQADILAVLAMTRLSTSEGADADSFVADFAGPLRDGDPALMARLDAAASSGLLQFSRLSATGEALVPLGATVETRDGLQRFAVTRDATRTEWREDLQGYLLLDTVGALQVPAVALTPGAASNVLAGAIAVITSAIPGVDAVSNPLAFTGGLDREEDEAFKIRFRAFVRSLREATPAALAAYVQAIRPGVSAKVVEFEDLDGTPRVAFAYLIVDDGSGDPPAQVLEAASAAARQHRAAGVEVAVYAPTIVAVDIAFTLALAVTGHEAQDLAAAEAAVRSYVNALPIGAELTRNKLYRVLYDAAPSILEVQALTLNGGVGDIAAATYEVVKADAVVGTQA